MDGLYIMPTMIGSSQQYEKMKKYAEKIDAKLKNALILEHCRIIRYDCLEDTDASSKEDHIRNICHIINDCSDGVFIMHEPDGTLSDDLVYISEYVEHVSHTVLRYIEGTDEIVKQINEDRKCRSCGTLCNPTHVRYITGSENEYLSRAERRRNRKAIYGIPIFWCKCNCSAKSWYGKPIPVRDNDGNDITKYIGIFDSLC